MKTKILLFEDDPNLRENIAELISVNGFPVEVFSSGEIASSSLPQKAIGICNASTIITPIDTFIGLLKEKIECVIVLCTDHQDPKIQKADRKIIMPFDEETLIDALNDSPSVRSNSLKSSTLKSMVELVLIGI